MYQKYKNVSLILIICFCCLPVLAQIKMINATNSLLYKKEMRSRNPGGMLDINGDLIDDIVVLDKGYLLKPMISDGKHLSLYIMDTLEIPKYPWTLTAGDINNDGKIEIFTSGEYNDVQQCSLKDGKWNFNLINGNVYAQGSNTIDFNNDGWLDYFLCDDDAPPKTYVNDKTGKLVQKSSVMNFTINDPTDGSGNYGSEWADVNGDFLPDLYLAKCRAGVNDATDQRRINRLYINQGNGTFIDKAGEFGVASGAQSWVGAIGDLDNDGDNDIFVANHYDDHVIYRNVDGKYFEKVNAPYLEQNFVFQALIRDMDNDGLQDIITAGAEGPFYLRNKGDLEFEYVDDVFLGTKSRSFVIGDINDDGFTDVYSMQTEPINQPALSDDELLINAGNNNHYVKVSLVGTQSNKSAIGAHASIYGPWGIQVRTVKGGESYGIVNSLQLHFGLGSNEKIDSLIVRWPSGQKDKFADLKIDQTLVIEEGKCLSYQEYITEDVLYVADSLKLPTVNDRNNYTWSNGASTNEITINAVGSYTLTSRDADGCLHISKPIIVRSACLSSDAVQVFENDISAIKICKSNETSLTALYAPKYNWNTGDTIKSIIISEPGMYSCTISDYCGSSYHKSITVTSVDPSFIVIGDTITKGNKATLVSSSENTVWIDGQTLTEVGRGDTLITSNLDTSKLYFAKNVLVINEKNASVGEKNLPVTDDYGGNNTEGNLIFDVINPITIKSVAVKTDKPGTRRLLIRKGVDIIWTKDIFIDTGNSQIDLNVMLAIGDNYSFETDDSINQVNFNHKGPRLTRKLGNTTYPYTVDGAVSIRNTKFGALYYYYFYNWEISHDLEYCESDLNPVVAFVKGSVATFDDIVGISLYPNPSSDFIYFKHELGELKILKITDQLGRQINVNFDGEKLYIADIPSGVYFVYLCSVNGDKVMKFVKN